MDINEFKQYVVDNFNISGEAHRLISNILYFVTENYTEENEQYKVLCSLLDGTIGLTDNEIKQIIVWNYSFVKI